MNAEKLEQEFAARKVPYGGSLLLLGPNDARELIERAREERIAILGIDGMFVTASATMSPLEHIANYSSVARGKGCWDDAQAFIAARNGTGMVFEVVLGQRVAPAV